MWGVEHTIMAIAFGGFALWFAWRRNWSWLLAAILSQIPFWAGSVPYIANGVSYVVGLNMCLNLVAAAMFVEWGHKLQLQGRGGVVHIWLSAIFVAAAAVDVLQVVYPMPFYVITQELLHYLALIAIGGRAYVRGLDGAHRYNRNRSNTQAGGRLV